MSNFDVPSPLDLDGSAISVLHVDDDLDLAELVSTYLERVDERLSVATTSDPESALERVRNRDVDAIVSDYDMPEMNGLELLDEVRSIDENLPFVLFTGKGNEAIASEAIRRGVTDYLQKQSGTEQYEVLANRVTNAVERQQARAQARRDQAAMNAAWDGIGILDEEGRFTYVNDAYTAVMGFDRQEMLGRPWAEFYPDGDSQVYDEILPTARDAGIWTGETTLQRADGETFFAAHAVASLDDGEVVCVLRDLTDREEHARELQHERDRFRLFVEGVDEYAFLMLDPEGYVTSWNEGARQIMGYEGDEIIGEHVSTFYPEETAASGLPDRLLERAADEGSITDQGLRVRQDGSTFWADVTITALYDEDHLQGFGTVTEDITEQIESERREERNEKFRRRLYEITSDPDRAIHTKVADLIDLGTERLDVPTGFLSFIDPATDRFEVLVSTETHPLLNAGRVDTLSKTYCRRTIDSGEILGLYDAATQGWAEDPAYEKYDFACYLGAKLEVDGDLFGTVCFGDTTPREDPFRHDDKAFVHLLGRWLTYELSDPDKRRVLLSDT